MNKEYNELITKYYDLGIEDKKKEIFLEFQRISNVLDMVSSFKKSPVSNTLTEYNPSNLDTEDENLVKIYNDLILTEEKLVYFLKSKGY